MSYTYLMLSRSGHDAIEIGIDQVTPTSVARAFSLDPTTVWLREEAGMRAFFPDINNTHFQFNDDVGITAINLIVEGSPTHGQSPVSSITTSTSDAGPSSSVSAPLPRPFFSSCRRMQSVNVKVVQARMKKSQTGKVEFTPLNQMFVNVTESTANVGHITNVIQEKWGYDHVVVTSDGLKVEESAGTRGLKFWKVGSRKMYAIRSSAPSQDRKHQRKIFTISDSSDSDGDFLSNRESKRRKSSTTHSDGQLESLKTEVKEMRQDIRALFEINKWMKVPVGLRRILLDTFRCHICQDSPITPPIIFARCCKSIIGCEPCVEAWYGGLEGQTRNCPKCRSERAYADTCRLLGMDEFLEAIKPSTMELQPSSNEQ